MVHGGGADGLVSLLCAFNLCVDVAALVVLGSHVLQDDLFAGTQAEVGEVCGVSTHVCNLSRFIEALGKRHRLRYGKTQLTGRLLLERGGSERQGRGLLQRLVLHVAYGEAGSLALLQKLLGGLLGLEAGAEVGFHLGNLAIGCGYKEGGHNPIGEGGDKGLNLAFTVHDETYRYRLHTSCGEGRFYPAPQHGRKLEAYDAVEHAACLLGIDKVGVDGAGMLNGILDGGGGNLVEDDTAGMLGVESQYLVEVPADGFSLAVFIGCQPDVLCTL